MIITVDTGGTKTLVAVFDTEGQIVAKQKFPTPAAIEDYSLQLRTTIDSLIDVSEISCLSIALPGTIRDGVMAWGGNLTWRNFDIRQLLSAYYSCPIIVENDANLAALAEARSLATPLPVCLYVTVSTGIGTGLITNGEINPYLSTGEGGQIMLEHNGSFARWETFASGKSILATYGKLASEIDDPATWHKISNNLAKGFLVLIPAFNPDIIIIGGGVGTHFDKFKTPLLEILNENLANTTPVPLIIEAAHPEEAVIYGCYYHAVSNLTN